MWWSFVLAQDSTGLFRSLVWLGVLIAMVIAAGVLLVVLRRRFLGPDQVTSADPLDLESIRRMHREGELSDDEFEAAKEAILGSLRSPRDGGGGAGSP